MTRIGSHARDVWRRCIVERDDRVGRVSGMERVRYGWLAAKGEPELAGGGGGGEGVEGWRRKQGLVGEDIVAIGGIPVAGPGRCRVCHGGRSVSWGGASFVE